MARQPFKQERSAQSVQAASPTLQMPNLPGFFPGRFSSLWESSSREEEFEQPSTGWSTRSQPESLS